MKPDSTPAHVLTAAVDPRTSLALVAGRAATDAGLATSVDAGKPR
jgi:hypothetical protein